MRLESPCVTASDCSRSTNPGFEAIRAYTAGGVSIEMSNFELIPFALQGGHGKIRNLSGEDLPHQLEEINLKLIA